MGHETTTSCVTADPPGVLTVSVVSHGHDAWLLGLVTQLASTGMGVIAHVVVTHNIPGSLVPEPTTGWPFRVTQVTNTSPAGFGTNHNRAFALAHTPLFCVLNPDMSLPDSGLWPCLVAAAQEPGVGCVFPALANTDGSVQDSARALLTPWALFRRRVLRQPEARMDWVSAAFWVVPSAVFARMGGFDERYFMYCEDADFCLRLQLGGWRLVGVPARAVHHAQRDSHRNWRHLMWHLQSLWRIWRSPITREYRKMRAVMVPLK